MGAQSRTPPRYLVTGGAGFIGSNIVADLVDSGAEVIVCDHLGVDERWRNLAKHAIADFVAPEDLFDYLQGARGALDALIHMGAISSTTERDIDLIMRTNFILSRDLWQWCAEHDTRFLYASSAATYGDGEQGFKDDESVEALRRLRPLNAYAWSKALFDLYVARRLAEGKPRPPQWAGFKFFNVYGPNEYHKGAMKSVIAQIFPKAAAGEAVTLFRSHHPDYEDGGQLRDFVSVFDCVKVIRWFLDHDEVNGLFNLGTGQARSFADLAKAVFAALNREARITYVDTPAEIRDKYQYFTQADMEKLRRAGYKGAFFSLEDGIADYVRTYLVQDDPYR